MGAHLGVHFGQYGAIKDIKFLDDVEQRKFSDSVLVTFGTIAAAGAAAKEPRQLIDGKQNDVGKIISDSVRHGECKLKHFQ